MRYMAVNQLYRTELFRKSEQDLNKRILTSEHLSLMPLELRWYFTIQQVPHPINFRLILIKNKQANQERLIAGYIPI
jgi:hypothetical protein